jgi:hypothetical protein
MSPILNWPEALALIELIARTPRAQKAADSESEDRNAAACLVKDSVHDERGMPDGPELSESLAFESFPLAERCCLSARDLRTRDWIQVVFAL